MKKLKITLLTVLFLSVSFAHALGPGGNVTTVECSFSNGDFWSITTNSESHVDSLISQCFDEGGMPWWEAQR